MFLTAVIVYQLFNIVLTFFVECKKKIKVRHLHNIYSIYMYDIFYNNSLY